MYVDTIQLKKCEKKSVTLEVMEKTLTQIYWFGFKDEGEAGEMSYDGYGTGYCGSKLRAPYGAFYYKPLSMRTAILNELIKQGMMNKDYTITQKGEQYCLECGYKWINTSRNETFSDGCFYWVSVYETTPTEPHERGKAEIQEWQGEQLIKNKVTRKGARFRPTCPNCKKDFEVRLLYTQKKDHYLTCPHCEYDQIIKLSYNNSAILKAEKDYWEEQIAMASIERIANKRFAERIERQVAQLKAQGKVFKC